MTFKGPFQPKAFYDSMIQVGGSYSLDLATQGLAAVRKVTQYTEQMNPQASPYCQYGTATVSLAIGLKISYRISLFTAV